MRRGLLGRAVRVTGALLVLSAIPPSPVASAQEGSAFGGYEVVANGSGFTVAPSVPAVLPVETPVEGTLALALASLSTGGLGYGLASSAYPGTPIVGIRPLLEVGAGVALPIPDYPIIVESREHEDAKSSRQPGITMTSDVAPGKATVTSDLGGFTLPGALDVGSVRTVSTSIIETARAAAVSVTELNGIDVLGGALHLDAVETWSSAETDSESSICDGGVTVTGATVGGTPVTIDESGIHSGGNTALPLGGSDPVAAVLESTGIQARTLGGTEACKGGTADRSTSGVLVSLPLPAVGAVPPGGRLDVILGSAAARTSVTPAFELDLDLPATDVPSVPDVGDVIPRPAGPVSGGGSIAPVGPGTGTDRATAAPSTAPAVALEPERTAYTFAGVPAGLVAGLMLLAVPGSRRIRRYMERVLAMAAAP